MTNIWSFLLQTLSVSLVAMFLLLLKRIFEDKLSPRWQYGVWILLAFRIILPVSMATNIFLPLPLLLETLKTSVERGLSSSYTEVFIPLSTNPLACFSIFQKSPTSITDWLFLIYIGGIVIFLMWYLLSYIRLRLLLRQGIPVSPTQMQQIQQVCQQYHLKTCKATSIPNLPSAFICGVINPILVLPTDCQINSKVLLHELLHLKYCDALQNVFWCIFRAIHWCNPFLHYVFHSIGNDMESLCDQRVLELLEGEERREYGNILLSMANEPFARALGTTSISNGGKNISKRIAAIVRFKKYPKGVALVSICIIILLINPLLVGTATAYTWEQFSGLNYNAEQTMAKTRLRRCSTMAGALDTYAKWLLYENVFFAASSTPLAEQEKWDAMAQSGVITLEEEMPFIYSNNGYGICNIQKIDDTHFQAILLFDTYEAVSSEEYDGAYLLFPVTVQQERINGKITWVVQRHDDVTYLPYTSENATTVLYEQLPPMYHFTATGETGTIDFSIQTTHYVQKDAVSGSFYFSQTQGLLTDAPFSYGWFHGTATYTCTLSEVEMPQKAVCIKIANVGNIKVEDFTFGKLDSSYLSSNSGGSGSNFHWSNKLINDHWNHLVTTGFGEYIDTHAEPPSTSGTWIIQILLDGELAETFILGERYE